MDRVGHRRAEKTLKRRSGRAEGSGCKIVVDEDDDESTQKIAWRCGHGGAYSPWLKI